MPAHLRLITSQRAVTVVWGHPQPRARSSAVHQRRCSNCQDCCGRHERTLAQIKHFLLFTHARAVPLASPRHYGNANLSVRSPRPPSPSHALHAGTTPAQAAQLSTADRLEIAPDRNPGPRSGCAWWLHMTRGRAWRWTSHLAASATRSTATSTCWRCSCTWEPKWCDAVENTDDPSLCACCPPPLRVTRITFTVSRVGAHQPAMQKVCACFQMQSQTCAPAHLALLPIAMKSPSSGRCRPHSLIPTVSLL